MGLPVAYNVQQDEVKILLYTLINVLIQSFPAQEIRNIKQAHVSV